jgi:hypothetical protein
MIALDVEGTNMTVSVRGAPLGTYSGPYATIVLDHEQAAEMKRRLEKHLADAALFGPKRK